MTDRRLEEILAELNRPNRHRLSWPERIMWGVLSVLVAITLLSLLAGCGSPRPGDLESASVLTCYHTLADMDSATTVETAWRVCHPNDHEGPKADVRTVALIRWAEKHAVIDGCDGLTYVQVRDTLIITARCPKWP